MRRDVEGSPYEAHRPRVVSIFSGAGGLDLGLERAGFETVACVEWEPWACETLRQNQGSVFETDAGDERAYLDGATIIEDDVRHVSGARLLRELRLAPGDLDVLCGGPPCVTFSVAGRREGLASETGRLFEAYARLLRVLRPRAFVFENVKGLLSAVGEDGMPGTAWRVIRSRLEEAGYRLSWVSLNAADYGVPQLRERVIVVGLRGRRGNAFKFPEPTHAGAASQHRIPWATVRDALAGMPPAAKPGEAPTVANHLARAHSEAVTAAFAATPPGKRNDAYKRDRLRWDMPAKVIRAQGKLKPDGSGQRHSSHQNLHPDEPRQLTVRECARLQTFPDWYWLPPHFSNGYRVVGDAVPPHLAAVIGRALLGELQQHQQRLMLDAAPPLALAAGD